jgi:hypothetical protein
MALILCACPYEGKVPLSSVSEAKIDPELLGKWIMPNKDANEEDFLCIYDFNGKEYLIEIYDKEKNKFDRLRAYTTTLKGHKLLNVNELPLKKSDNIEYGYVKYEIKDDKLYYQTVEDKLIKGDYASSQELFCAVLENIDNNDLFSEVTILDRAATKEE